MISDVQVVLEAAYFAALKHSGQKRKGVEGEPYVNHVLEVALLVASSTEAPDPTLVAAALLHDTVEDTGVTHADLVERFGQDVADLVMEVTDDKTLEKAERKRRQVENAPKKSERAQAIKLADKISNLRGILTSPPANWDYARKKEYFEWSRQVIGGLRSPNPVLMAEFERTYDRFVELSE